MHITNKTTNIFRVSYSLQITVLFYLILSKAYTAIYYFKSIGLGISWGTVESCTTIYLVATRKTRTIAPLDSQGQDSLLHLSKYHEPYLYCF